MEEEEELELEERATERTKEESWLKNFECKERKLGGNGKWKGDRMVGWYGMYFAAKILCLACAGPGVIL